MKKTQKERLDELFKLIKDNPELPILPMVDGEIVADDGYARWTASWGSAEIIEYINGENCFYFKNLDDFHEVEKTLCDIIGWDEYEKINGYEEAEKEYNNLPWVKAIAVNIDLPEV